MNILNNILKGFLSFFIAIFMISFAIAFVILFRPYYYLNIHILNLEEESGYTYSEIVEAYDDVMDYLVFGEEFKTGKLPYSEDGKSHFEDCKRLFSFDFLCLAISGIYILVIFILQKYKILNLKFKHFSPGIYSIIGICAIFSVLTVWGIIDFDNLFITFHLIAFSGKTNWGFNPVTDQIINVLPLEVWMNFCILIVAIIIIFIIGFIIYEIKRRKKLNNIKNIL